MEWVNIWANYTHIALCSPQDFTRKKGVACQLYLFEACMLVYIVSVLLITMHMVHWCGTVQGCYSGSTITNACAMHVLIQRCVHLLLYILNLCTCNAHELWAYYAIWNSLRIPYIKYIHEQYLCKYSSRKILHDQLSHNNTVNHTPKLLTCVRCT